MLRFARMLLGSFKTLALAAGRTAERTSGTATGFAALIGTGAGCAGAGEADSWGGVLAHALRKATATKVDMDFPKCPAMLAPLFPVPRLCFTIDSFR
jgi:hypothetical protein